MMTKSATHISRRQPQDRRGDVLADKEHRREFVEKIQRRARELQQRAGTVNARSSAAERFTG